MKTIQVELSDQQFDALKNISEGQGKSISDVVNMALEQILSVQMEKDTDKILSEVMSVAGIWADRDDIGDTVGYVLNLRKGTAERLRRLGIWDDRKFYSAN